MDKYKISAEEFAKVSISRLATHPNTSTAFGESRMSEQDLKKRFDKQGELFRAKFNAFLEIIGATGDGESLAGKILTGISKDHTLKALFEDIISESGRFASYLSVGDMTLMEKLQEIAAHEEEVKQQIEAHETEIEERLSEASQAADEKYVKLVTTGEKAYCYTSVPGNPNYTIHLAQQPGSYTVARRYDDGRLRVGAPVEELDAVNRGFADNNYVGKKGDQTIAGRLSVGDLYVAGSAFAKDVESLAVKEAVVVANSDGVPLSELSGYVIRVNETAAYGILYDPAESCVKIGLGTFDSEKKVFTYDAGEAQPLATRGAILNGHIPVWDEIEKTFADGGVSLEELISLLEKAEAARAEIEATKKYVDEVVASKAVKKYSVRFSGSASAGTREDDAVGMIANVAVGDEVVQNDFDNVSFFNRPICCCTWDAAARKWRVNAYKGEPGFAWDGSNGEVMYECTPFYYKAIFEGVGSPTYVSVTATPCEGYELAPLFKNGEDKVYCPCFNMALVDDVAVSRAGLVPYYGSLNAAMEKARKFDAKAHTETIEALFSDALLLWVEFATKNWRSVMFGCANLVYNTTTRVSSVVSETEFKTTYSGLVAGQNIALGSGEYGTNRHANVEIASVEVDPSDSTLYVVKLVEAAPGLAANDYISSRMYKTGKAALAVTNASSGSPVSNTSGKYPCIWRGKENPWGNGFSTLCNVLSKRYGEEGSYTYKLQYLPDPSKYANGAITEDYIEANFNLATTDGYAKTLGQDTRYPFLFCTSEVGASSTTYIGAYYYYPRYEVGAVRVGGGFYRGGYVGLFFYLSYAPSDSGIYYAARLFCSQ